MARCGQIMDFAKRVENDERRLRVAGPTVRSVQAALGRLARQYQDARREVARQRGLLLGC